MSCPRGKDCAEFVLKSLDGARGYQDLGHHFPSCTDAPYDSVAEEGKTFGNMGDFGLCLGERQPHVSKDLP